MEELPRRYHLVDLLGPALSALQAARRDQSGRLHLGQNLDHPGPGPPHRAEQSVVGGTGPTQRLELNRQHVRRSAQGGQSPLTLDGGRGLSLIHISEPTRRTPISYAV